MSDEPTNSELARRLDAIQLLLQSLPQSLVGRAEYAADQRALEHRFAELAADVEDVRRQGAENNRVVHQRISDSEKTSAGHRQHWQQLIYMGLIPALVVAAGTLVTIWLGQGGSH